MSKADAKRAARLSDAGKVIGFRNVLIHGYATVDNRLVWGVIETNLGPLRTMLANLLAPS